MPVCPKVNPRMPFQRVMYDRRITNFVPVASTMMSPFQPFSFSSCRMVVILLSFQKVYTMLPFGENWNIGYFNRAFIVKQLIMSIS